MKKYLTVDIGGTEIKYAVLDSNIHFYEKSKFPSKGHISGQAILDDIINLFKTLSKNYELEGIAISSAGVIHPDTGEVLFATDSIKDYRGLNIASYLSSALNVKVSVENDVNCMALCESSFGSGKDYHHISALTIGTGIGGAVVLNGHILRGASYSAGEFGQILINEHRFEAIASMTFLVQSAKKVIGKHIESGIDVYNLYDKKDEQAIQLVHTFYDNLAFGITNIVHINNPEIIILGGGITNRPSFLDEFMPFIKKHLRSWEFERTKFKLAQFKNDAGMIGAFIHFSHKYLSN